MTIQPAIILPGNAYANLNPIPWKEQELPFAEGPRKESSVISQESTEYGPELEELTHKQPSIAIPLGFPLEDKPRLAVPEIKSIADIPFENKTEEDSDYGNPLPPHPPEEPEFESETGIPDNLPQEDVSGFEDESPQEEPDFEKLYDVPQFLRYHGYDYIQVCRGNRSCLYRQTLSGETISFEVFLIRIQPEVLLGGKVLPAHERFPRDEDFGKTAWTHWTLAQAMEKFNELENGKRNIQFT